MEDDDHLADHSEGVADLSLMASFDSHDDFVNDFVHEYGLERYKIDFQSAASLFRKNVSAEELSDLGPADLCALRAETTHKWRQPWTLYVTVLMCFLGAIEQGMAQTSMNGANLYFPKEFDIASDSAHDTLIVGLINSGIYLSVGIFGAWLSDPVNGLLGRRGAVALGSAICLVANFASAMSGNWQVLLFFRLILGAGLGLNVATINVYAAEMAPSYIRGGLAVSWQMFTAFGLFVGFVANIAVYNVRSPWRWQLAFPCLPVIPLFACIWLCPESPAYLIKSNGDYHGAFMSLRRVRNSNLQAARDVWTSYTQRPKCPSSRSSLLRRFCELFTIPRIRHASLAAFTVMLSQQLCGINIIAFFSSTIFLDSGFSRFQALLASTIFGFVNFIGAIPAVWTMESLGRRKLLLMTLPAMALTMFAAALTFRLDDSPARFGLPAGLIYLFCALYSPGMGPVPAPYSAEVYPLSHRELGMSFAVSVANSWAAVLSLTFPRLLALLQAEGAFELYAGLNMVAFTLVFLFVRETKMKSLDDLDDTFSTGMVAFVLENARYEILGAKRASDTRSDHRASEPRDEDTDVEPLLPNAR